MSFDTPQWGPAFWAVLIALIWFWVAAGFWNLRVYAWTFGNFIAIFTVIFGFFAILGGSTTEAETVGWFLAIAIFFYLNYPGVQAQFVEHELSLMTPSSVPPRKRCKPRSWRWPVRRCRAQRPRPPPRRRLQPSTPPAPPANPGTPSS